MTVLSNIITPSNVLTTTNTATVTNKTLTSPTVAGMTVSDGTANGVTFLNGSKVLTSGSALTFAGGVFGINSASAYLSVTTTSGASYLGDAPSLISGSGASDTALRFDGSNLIFSASNLEKMRLTSAGNVGIGTSSPAYKLHVVVASNKNVVAFAPSSSSGISDFSSGGVGWIFSRPSNGGLVNSVYSYDTAAAAKHNFVIQARNDLVFTTDGDFSSATERMRISDTGNLGLGVTPSAWGSGNKALQIGSISALWQSSGYSILSNNVYQDSGGNKYLTTTGAGEYAQLNGSHFWFTAPSGTAGNTISFTQAMTLEASGNLLVGGTSQSGAANRTAVFSANKFGLSIIDTTAQATGVGGALNLGGNYRTTGDAQAFARVAAVKENSTDGNYAYGMAFSTTPNGGTFTEAGRFDSVGNLLVGTTNTNPGGADINGIALRPGNFSVISALGTTPFGINRGTDDGTLINFSQAGTTEGSISVSGTTVSYNGGHLSRYAQTTTAKDNSLVKGTVLSNLDEMNVYTKNGQPVDNEQLNKVKVSDTEGDVNVAGVFVNWSHDEDHNVDEINMAMTGDMIIRIAQGVTVVRGDLLMSAGDGTAKPQGDDIIRSKTVAKVTSNHVTCTYADGSYCVPCVLMAC